jgi:uncharacterized OsmC-like protein
MAIITKNYKIQEDIKKEEGGVFINITFAGMEKKKRDQIEELAEKLANSVSELLTNSVPADEVINNENE